MRDPEYDRFGPWILEISESDTLPPLFEPFFPREEDPLYCVKIPRPMDRRDLSPGMNMYDYVVALYEVDLLILERDGENVKTLSILYSDIVALRHSEDLLSGQLHIYTVGKCYILPYSTVSVEMTDHIVDLIRARYNPPTTKGSPDFHSPGTPDPEEMSFYFNGVIGKYSLNHPEKKFIAHQREIAVHSIDSNFWRQIFYGAIDKKLLESIHFFNGNELEIIDRGRKWSYRWQVNYGKDTLYLPVKNIRKIDRIPDSTDGIESLTFRTDISEHSFLFMKDNPGLEIYARLLNDRYSSSAEVI